MTTRISITNQDRSVHSRGTYTPKLVRNALPPPSAHRDRSAQLQHSPAYTPQVRPVPHNPAPVLDPDRTLPRAVRRLSRPARRGPGLPCAHESVREQEARADDCAARAHCVREANVRVLQQPSDPHTRVSRSGRKEMSVGVRGKSQAAHRLSIMGKTMPPALEPEIATPTASARRARKWWPTTESDGRKVRPSPRPMPTACARKT